MKKIITLLIVSFSMLLTACGDKSIDGVYQSKGGKVGIYEMDTMTIQKASDNKKYNITFTGAERTLTYDNVEYKDGELKISDKGFMMPVKIEGGKATIQEGGAVFEKSANKPVETPKASETQQTPAPAPAPAQAAKANYPDELIGKWATGSGDKACRQAIKAEKQTGMWDGLSIAKDGSYGMEFSCEAASVVKNGDAYSIVENCASQGEEFKISSEYNLLGNTLKVTADDGSGKKNQYSYTSCKPPVVCTVNPGQAGVTTFMDEKLTKAAPNSIRDFDGYTFKSDKTIVVDKTNVLVGKLYTSDGRPSKGSYAIADEWTCK